MTSQLENIAELTAAHRQLLSSISQRAQEDDQAVLSLITALRQENDVIRGLLESRYQDFTLESERIQQESALRLDQLQLNTEATLAELEKKLAALLSTVPTDNESQVGVWTQEQNQRQKDLEEAQLECMNSQRELDLLKTGPVLTQERMLRTLRKDLEIERNNIEATQRLLDEKRRYEEEMRGKVEEMSVKILKLREKIASDREVLARQTDDLHRLRADKAESKAQVLALQHELAEANRQTTSLQTQFSLLQAQYSALHTRVRGLVI